MFSLCLLANHIALPRLCVGLGLVNNNMQNHEQKKSGWGVNVTTLILIFVSPILYVLSVGPVVGFYHKMQWSTSVLATFYYPLIWLVHNNPFRDETLDLYVWYVELFTG